MIRNIEKHEKWEMHTVGREIWQDNWKCGKWETHTVGHEIWRGKLKMLENKKCPLEDMQYGKKTDNHGKWETPTGGLEKW